MQQLKMPVPLDWTIADPFEQKVEIEGMKLFLSGLQATHQTWGEVVGSAASAESFPSQRAFFELLERISIIESMARDGFVLRDMGHASIVGLVTKTAVFPQAAERDGPVKPAFQFARSNGVALHDTWAEACRRACFELVERHLVLRSWIGQGHPQILRHEFLDSELNALRRCYEVLPVSFGQQAVSCLPGPVFAAGIVMLPKRAEVPLVLGFGAGLTILEALGKARDESFQRLGFLWGEDIPAEAPDFEPSALYHQDYYLVPAARPKLEKWLDGAYLISGFDPRPTGDVLQVRFADLGTLNSQGYQVAKALCPEAIPLVFGHWRQREFSHVPDERLIHPIA